MSDEGQGCDPRNSSRYRVPLKQLPDDLFAQADSLRLTAAVHGAEHVTIGDSGAGGPRILRHLHPRRHRDRPDPAVLTHEVHDAPPSRCWMWPTVSAATSERRNPQPSMTARTALSRRPFIVVVSGVFSKVWHPGRSGTAGAAEDQRRK